MTYFRKMCVVLFMLFASSAVYAAAVDINTAGAEALALALKGVGPDKAAAIIEYRSQHGPFKTAEDLMKVKGIGPKIIEDNRGNIKIEKQSH